MIIKLGKLDKENIEFYFKGLEKQIKDEGLTQIKFKSANDFFKDNFDRGIDVYNLHKQLSGFDYRLELPKFEDAATLSFYNEKVDLLGITATKLKSFKSTLSSRCNYTFFYCNQLLMVNRNDKKRIIVEVCNMNDPNLPIFPSVFELETEWTGNHHIKFLFKEGLNAYFATESFGEKASIKNKIR